MSINPSSIEVHVEDTAILIIDDETKPTGVKEDGRITYAIANTGPDSVYVGADDVTDLTGLPVASGGAFTISIRHNGKLYAIAENGNEAYVRILVVP